MTTDKSEGYKELELTLDKFGKVATNREMWEAFDNILLTLTKLRSMEAVSLLEKAEHEIYEQVEDTTAKEYKAGLLAGAAQATVAFCRLFPIPENKVMKGENIGSINEELSGFTGTERYYAHFAGLRYTDGVKALADKFGAYWLIDIVASYQQQLKGVPFQVWGVKLTGEKKGYVYCKEDTDKPLLVTQELDYMDFPQDYELYAIGGVLLLKSEY